MKMAIIRDEQIAWVPDDAQVGDITFCLIIDPDCFESEIVSKVLELIED